LQQILVVAESNEAVNNLFNKIREAGIDLKIVLRLGNTDRMPEAVQLGSFDEHYQKNADVKQRQNFDSKLAQEILDCYRVRNTIFVCTLKACMQPSAYILLTLGF